VIKIETVNLGKKFTNEWIFRKLDLQLLENQIYAVVGANGSGKSTLLQVLMGMLPASEGEMVFSENDKKIAAENIFRYISLAAPYLELIEEMTLAELVQFHGKFKQFDKNLSVADLIEKIKLPKAKHKAIRFFSSGMKQRVKLGLAMYAQTPILFLDEPSSNLDSAGFEWYKTEIVTYSKNRLLIVASNQLSEYDFLNPQLIPVKPDL
jgi:ABC-type multidrug transport system ATPase subunit